MPGNNVTNVTDVRKAPDTNVLTNDDINSSNVTDDVNLTFDWALTLARLWDTEDLTCPPHSHYTM